MKKIFFILLAYLFSQKSFALPGIGCAGMPGCKSSTTDKPTKIDTESVFAFLGTIISEGVKYVTVIAVLALMLAGLNFILGGGLSGDEEKVKKAQKWVFRALIGVIVSVSSMVIIEIISNLRFE